MKSVSILPHIYVSLIVCFFLHTIAIQSHGFEEGTNVRTCENTWYGSIRAVAKFVVNRKKRCVASYDTTTQHHVQHVTVPLEEMENNWHRCYPFLQDEREEWDELTYVYHEYEYGDSDHLHQRSNALEDIGVHGATYTQDTYVVTDDVVQILRTYGHESAEYTTLYGNQFQHVLHQECIALLKRTSIVPVTSIVHAHKEALVNCIDAARAFNHEGFVHKASVISDFCWAFLDYGSAVVEGAALGLIGAVVDMAMRPVSTAACIVAGEWVFAYQLAKVTYTIADLGITYCIDPSNAHKKWDEITKPFDEIIDGLDAGAISCRDALKAGVAFGAGWRAHGKLLGGLGKLYRGIKTRVIEFAKNNPLMPPQEYMQTSDGSILRVSSNIHSLYNARDVNQDRKLGPITQIVKVIQKITSQEAAEIAKKLGFRKTNYYIHNQPVFQKGNKFITTDIDSHNGGFWKMADSIKNLSRKTTRMGTYDQNLKRIGD
jgi:hypothetical protein